MVLPVLDRAHAYWNPAEVLAARRCWGALVLQITISIIYMPGPERYRSRNARQRAREVPMILHTRFTLVVVHNECFAQGLSPLEGNHASGLVPSPQLGS